MNWRKRKRCRKIAHHYGFKHWWEYNRYLKAAIKTEHSRYIVDHPNEFHWRELLNAYNKICDEFGTPEKKLTENEWWDKVKEYTNEMMIDRDREFMDLLDEAIRKHRISSKHNIDVIRGHRLTDEEVANMIQDPFGGDFDGDTLAVIPVNTIMEPPSLKADVQGRIAEYHQAVAECLKDPSVEGLMAYHGIVAGSDGEKYPVQTHVDLAQNPDVTTEARIGISPKGDVKFYGFDICKT